MTQATTRRSNGFRARDDVGNAIHMRSTPQRIVSLVPSMTEAIAVTRPGVLVGATEGCTRPADLKVARIGLPIAPAVAAIAALDPDLVVASRHENRPEDLDALRERGLSVWVTDVRSVGHALHSMCRLFADALHWEIPVWLETAAQVWSGPVPIDRVPAAIVVGREPWVVVGESNFMADLARQVGLRNVFHDVAEPYVRTTVDEIIARHPQLVILLDEPDLFTPDHGPAEFGGLPCPLVGRHCLTWYGPSLVESRRVLVNRINQARVKLKTA